MSNTHTNTKKLLFNLNWYFIIKLMLIFMYVYLFFILQSKIFCFVVERASLQPINFCNKLIYKSNGVSLENLSLTINNFRNYALNYNNSPKRLFWYYEFLTPEGLSRKKSFYKHPLMYFYDNESKCYIFKHFTSTSELSRSYTFIDNYYNQQLVLKEQYITTDFSVVHANEVVAKLATCSQLLNDKAGNIADQHFIEQIKKFQQN